jgi:antitoxin (DNA-binding transcriptional repressor) of toxin-antitoxin stability system
MSALPDRLGLDRRARRPKLERMSSGNRIPTAAARKQFANTVKRSAGGERIKLTRYNKTLAVIIPKKDLAMLEECERAHTSSGRNGRR